MLCRIVSLTLQIITAAGLQSIVKVGEEYLFTFSFEFLALYFSILGGLFDVADQVNTHGTQETAFRYAVDRINNNKEILNSSLLSAQIEKIPPRDSFHTYKRGRNLEEGVFQ